MILKKFKSNYQPYLFIICTILILVPVLLWRELGFGRYVICVPLIIFQCLNAIEMIFFIYVGIEDKGITNKTFFSKKFIDWDKIYGVYYNNATPLYKSSIKIVGDSVTFNVDSWTKDSKELIKIIVDECKKRNIKVELMVEKIIED
jgi:hypothetical protein